MADQSEKYKFDISNLNLHYGDFQALKVVNMQIGSEYKITSFYRAHPDVESSTFFKEDFEPQGMTW